MKVCVGWLSVHLAFRFVGAVGNHLVLCAALTALLMQYFVLAACVLSTVSSRSIEYRYAAIESGRD